MSQASPAFEGQVSESFAQYADTVRGYVRYELVRQNLGSLAMKPRLEVVDVGGGTGMDAIWLAGQGHDVTLVELAAAQIVKARQNIDAEPHSEIGERIKIVQGTSTDLLEQGQADRYDLVLSHGVAMYLPNPDEFIGELASLTKSGGHTSLLEKGFYGAQASLVSNRKYGEALEINRTRRFRNHMGREVWAFLPEELEDYLNSSGLDVVSWSGVRVNHDRDDRLLSEVDSRELATIVDDEYEVGHRLDTRGLGQMLHFIAKKQEA